jgi:hypothetical protein
MIMRPSLPALAAQMMVLTWPAWAQAPQPAPPSTPATQAIAPADPAMTGATARPAPPRSGRPTPTFRPKRQPRPYGVCRQRARERGLRGGDRRSFIIRCQLGYGGGQPAPARR